MAQRKKKIKLEIIYTALIIIILMASSLYVLYRTETKLKPIVKEKIDSNGVNYLIDFYADSVPNIEGRAFFGSKDAAINFIAHLDTTSEASRFFMSEMFPQLKQDYVDSGLVKIYFKNHITLDDFNNKNEKYIYAKSLLCVGLIDKDDYYPFYFDLFNIDNVKGIKKLLEKHKIPLNKYNDCMQETEFEELKEDISETEDFGLQGINARFYIGIPGTNFKTFEGIPNYRKFNKTIRDYSVIMGN